MAASKKRDSRLSKLVSRATSKRIPGPGCFAGRLSGDAREFLDLLTEKYKGGEYVNRKQAHRILVDEFEINVGSCVVSRHIAGDCMCGRKE